MSKIKNIAKRLTTWLAIFGLLIPLNAIPQKAKAASLTVVINEYMAKPASDWDGDSVFQGGANEYKDEWIELYNLTNAPISIVGWVLSDTNDNYTIPSGTIPANSAMVFFGSLTSVQLPNNADTITLKDNLSATIDSSVYSTAQTNDISKGRVPEGSDTDNDATDFTSFGGANGVPTPGAKNVPDQPTITTPASPMVVNANTTTLSGSTTANRTVRLYKGAVEVSNQTSDGSGGFSFTGVALTQDTVNNFSVKAENGTNAVTSATSIPAITEDSTKPILSETTPVTTPTSDSTPNYTFTSNEAGAITYSGDCSSATSSAISGANTITLNALSEAVHSNCTVSVTDSAGNVSNILPVSSFTIDTTKPTVTITPIATPNADNTPTFTGTASDTVSNIVSVEYQIDGGAWTATTATDGTFNSTSEGYTLTTSALSDASHTINVRATDLAGNITTSFVTSTQTFTIDTSAPTTPTINPVNSPVNAETQIVTGTAEVGSTVTLTNGIQVGTSIADGTGNYSFIVNLTQDAINTITVVANDLASNVSTPAATTTIIEDSTNPSLTVSSPTDGELIASATPTATYSATDTNSLTYEVRVDDVVVPGHISGASLGTLTDGAYSLKFTASDFAGNSTSVTRNIIINTALSSEPLTTQFTGVQTDQTINDIANTGIIIEGINTTGDVTFNIGEYAENPGANFSGISAFGKFFEVNVSDDSAIDFPLTIKIYYTQADLDSAGITEGKLDGIYYYDVVTHQWTRYTDTGVSTTNVTVGGTDYAGFVWVNADHLTPIVAVSDTTAPSKPANFKATAGDGGVDLTWNAVSDAQNYKIRYRLATNDDTFPYTETTIDGSKTSTTITNLENDSEYEFGIASIDQVGNVSKYAVAVATPKSAEVISAPSESSGSGSTTQEQTSSPTITTAQTPIKFGISPSPEVVDQVAPTTPAPTKTVEPTKKTTDDQGQIKGEETKSDSSRAAVTLAILLLALAAGVGGYYGYEWYLMNKENKAGIAQAQNSKDKPKTPTKQTSKTSRKRSGRW